MQKLILCFFCSVFMILVNAQTQIQGFWFNNDSSRIYSIINTERGLEAYLKETNRIGEKQGKKVLDELVWSKKGYYKAFIHSVDDNSVTTAKVRLINDSTLQLILRRMFVLPVTIYWFKKRY